MRIIKFDEYSKKRAQFAETRARLGLKREPSSRQRDEQERELLIDFDRARLEKWKKEGKLEVIGPRKYRFTI